jgi:hypothetical protein
MERAGELSSVEALAAKQAITEVLYQYCHAMDRIDPERGYDVWHPGGTANYVGMFEGSGRDFVDWGQESHATVFDGTSHQVTNILISLDGDRATSESYVTAVCKFKDSDNALVERGRYQDTWSFRNGKWRIDARRFIEDLREIRPVAEKGVMYDQS